MRVALFFDGKNFYRGLCSTFPNIEIDYDKLADWIVRQVGGSEPVFSGAYYYTGYSEGPNTRGQDFSRFLRNLNYLRGFFVRREPRVRRQAKCPLCKRTHYYRTEKRVDSRLVAEMIHYAAANAYDIAVLFSGDQDLVPAVEAVDRLGRKVFVATWRGRGLSPELRERCFDHINLADGVASFQTGKIPRRICTPRNAPPAPARPPVESVASTKPDSASTASPVLPAVGEKAASITSSLIREIRMAATQLPNISRWYFENRWRGKSLPPCGSPERLAIVNQGVVDGVIEEYTYEDSKKRSTNGIRERSAEKT